MQSNDNNVNSSADENRLRDSNQSENATRAATSSGSLPPKQTGQPLLVSLLLVGSLALGVLATLTPHYETNDDAAMNAIAAGRGFVDQPDEHLIYSNVLLGLALKFLYAAAPQIPWYGGLWFLTACVSLFAICFACLRNDLSEWTVGLTGTLLWLAGIPVLTQLQFTRVGFLAGLAGLLLLASGIRTPGGSLHSWFAIPLLLIGALIRIDAFRLVFVVLSPVLFWMLWRARSQKNARYAIAILAACFALGIGAAQYNRSYYGRDAAWQAFFPFNALRVEFMDFDRAEYNDQTAAAFNAAGWLPVDVQMLRNWAFLDQDRYTSQKLQAILDAAPSANWQSPRPWHALTQQMATDSELWGLLACGVAALAILAIGRSVWIIPLACYVVTGVACLLIYRYMHLPARVYCPVFGGCAATAIVLSAGRRSLGSRPAWVERRVGRYLALALIGSVIAWRGAAIWRSNANFVSYHDSAVRMLKQLAPRPNQLFVIWAGDFPFEFVTLPLARQSLPADFKVMTMGWTTGFTRLRLHEHGAHDLMSLVRQSGPTYFICEKADADLLNAYFRAHYGVGLKEHVVFAHPALYDSAVYQLTVDGPTPGS
jgi:hypothetical protein